MPPERGVLEFALLRTLSWALALALRMTQTAIPNAMRQNTIVRMTHAFITMIKEEFPSTGEG